MDLHEFVAPFAEHLGAWSAIDHVELILVQPTGQKQHLESTLDRAATGSTGPHA